MVGSLFAWLSEEIHVLVYIFVQFFIDFVDSRCVKIFVIMNDQQVVPVFLGSLALFYCIFFVFVILDDLLNYLLF